MEHGSNPYAQLGISIAAVMVGFTLLGVWLDRRYETEILFTLIGVAIAAFYIGYELWKVNKSINEDSKKNDCDKNADES